MWASEHRRPLRIIIILGITANRRIAAHFLLAFTLSSKISVIAYADDGCHFLFEILTHFRIQYYVVYGHEWLILIDFIKEFLLNSK